MGRFTFWLWLGACFVAALAVYALQVRTNALQVEQLSHELEALAARAENLAGNIVGSNKMATSNRRRREGESAIGRIDRFFTDRDAANLDRWFPTLAPDWTARPKREEFVRFHGIYSDILKREAQADYKKAGVENAHAVLIEHEWEGGKAAPPEVADLRRLQREFWIQDRIIRALSRHGAWLSRALRGGETQRAVGTSDQGPRCDRIRYDCQVLCPSAALLDVLHAFDAPFQVTHEDGFTELLALHLMIDNLSVRRVNLDSSTALKTTVEPPVEINFFLTILDFSPSES